MPHTVYALIDPNTQQVRYIGCTKQPLATRLRRHIARAKLFPSRPVCAWLLSLNARPTIKALQEVADGDDWQAAERHHIAACKDAGADLTNLTKGGLGIAGVRFDDEHCERMRKRFAGREFTPEWRARISAARRGQKMRPQPPDVVARRIAAATATKLAKRAARSNA